MPSLEQYLSNVKEIVKLALENKSDEEIAKMTGIAVGNVTLMRRSMGIRKTWSKDIFNGEEKVALQWWDRSNNPKVHFTIPRVRIEELGLDNKTNYAISGRIVGKGKVEIIIKPSI